MKRMILLVATMLWGLMNVASGQTFLVADGSSSGTYQQFLKEMTTVFEEDGIKLEFKEVPSSGAVENLDKLINNDVMAAFMHGDVIWHRNKSDASSKLEERFQTLVSLFPEDVHFVALSESRTKAGGVAGFGAKRIEFKSVSDLSGYKVGAAGGGYVTSNIIKLLSDIPYQIVKYDTGKEVMAALASGEISAAVFVGAAPLPNLKDLGPDYKILPISDLTIDKLKSSTVYQSSQVTYTKMSPQPVRTVSVTSLLVAHVYHTPKMVSQLKAMRTAFYSHLTELQETPGNHKKWQDVDPSNHGSWTWMNLGK